MIYFDNSATTLIKPPQVAEAVAYAVNNFGNAGRSFYTAVMLANREIYKTRAVIAGLAGLDDPLRVAFTSSSTESLNLVIAGLVKATDRAVTTVTEHNSVLRPLYRTGCRLEFIGCGDDGALSMDSAEKLLTPGTRALVCTHGSNVTGNLTDVARLREICLKNGIIMVLDVSQTFGSIPVSAEMADVLCFTGHKALFGPQGTGGVVVSGDVEFEVVKTGGAGVNSFDKFQSKSTPDIFEVGTVNSHSVYGLQKGAGFVSDTGVKAIHEKETKLLRMFYEAVSGLPRVKIYGDFAGENRLPVISLNVEGLSSGELAERLWEEYGVATRAGSHCAPLLHRRMGTEKRGTVRFSFSYFNTESEIAEGVSALKEIIKSWDKADAVHNRV